MNWNRGTLSVVRSCSSLSVNYDCTTNYVTTQTTARTTLHELQRTTQTTSANYKTYTNYKNRLHELQKLHFRNIKPIFKVRNQYLISTTRKCEIFFLILLSLNINFVSVFLMNRLLFLGNISRCCRFTGIKLRTVSFQYRCVYS